MIPALTQALKKAENRGYAKGRANERRKNRDAADASNLARWHLTRRLMAKDLELERLRRICRGFANEIQAHKTAMRVTDEARAMEDMCTTS